VSNLILQLKFCALAAAIALLLQSWFAENVRYNPVSREALASPLFATGRVECNSIPSKILARGVPFCVVLPSSFDADKARHFPVLYFLHGLGDSEQFFIHSGAWNLVEDMREKGELGDFLIATPGARSSFYINARDGKERYEISSCRNFSRILKNATASLRVVPVERSPEFPWVVMEPSIWHSAIPNFSRP